MKKITLSILFGLFIILTISGQDKFFRQTYVFDGNMEISTEKSVSFKMNFLILIDSSIVGSYYYNPGNGSLKLSGILKSDLSFVFVERDENDSITGYFNGKLSSDFDGAFGTWKSSLISKETPFKLKRAENTSYWSIIKKNRGYYEYTDFNTALEKSDSVLSIDVAGKGLQSVPKEIKKLKYLESINLLGNAIQVFPIELTKVPSLDEISLSSNSVASITPKIKKLHNLKILIINNNQLQSLPKQIGDLSNLLYLELGNNQLTSLPEEIKYLTNLQELHIERNRFSEEEKNRIKKLLPNCIIHF